MERKNSGAKDSFITASKKVSPVTFHGSLDFSEFPSPYSSLPQSQQNTSRPGSEDFRISSFRGYQLDSARGDTAFGMETKIGLEGIRKPRTTFPSFGGSFGLGEKLSRSLLSQIEHKRKSKDLGSFQPHRSSGNFGMNSQLAPSNFGGSSMTNFHRRSTSLNASSRFYSSNELVYAETISKVDAHHRNELRKGTSDAYTSLKIRAKNKLSELLEQDLKLPQKEVEKIMKSKNPYAKAFEIQTKNSIANQSNQNNEPSNNPP